MDDNKLDIICKHGKGTASIVCGHHLVSIQPVGFIQNSYEPNDLQGWCYACEYLFGQEGEMTPRFKKFTNAKVVCEQCFEEIKNAHLTE